MGHEPRNEIRLKDACEKCGSNWTTETQREGIRRINRNTYEHLKAQLAIEHDKRVAAEAALRVFKRYGKHRGSCVQMAGKQCSCGFDDAATRAGALSKLPATTPDRSEHGADCVCADGITSACRTITPKENV